MKKRLAFWMLFAALLLSACGGAAEQNAKTMIPYLTAEEREEIEQPILNSMSLTADQYSAGYYRLLVSFCNESDEYLYDFAVRTSGNGRSLFSLNAVPPHTDVSISFSYGERTPMEYAKAANNLYDIEYTIGDFAYERTGAEILMTEKQFGEKDETVPPIVFLIETENGMVELNQDGRTVFGEENPLACKVIRADYAEFRNKMEYSTDGYYYYNSICLYGELLEGKEAYYHLYDEEGYVLETGSLYFSSYNDHPCYLSLPYALMPGTYTIRFEEVGT